MYKIIISEDYAGKTLVEIIRIYGEQRGVDIRLEECVIFVEGKIVDLENLTLLLPCLGQEVIVFRVPLGG